MSGVEGLVERYRDTMGLTREGAIRRMHVLMDAITDLQSQLAARDAEVERLREAMEPLARLQIPSVPQGNAGIYSIYHKHIIAARAARGGEV